MAELDLPVYLPVAEAAGRYAIGDEQLEQAIAGGLLRAVRLLDFVAVEELGVRC